MKKVYLMPMVKTMRLPEPLMDATVSGTEIDPGQFKEGAKGFDMEEGEGETFVIKQRNVWED